MRYVSWAVLYEGNSDGYYLDTLLPRVIRDLIGREGRDLVDIPDAPAIRLGSKGRAIQVVANEACVSRHAYDLIFIHADAGGRATNNTIEARSASYCAEMRLQCVWPAECCITITPKHETEAWLISDGLAVVRALGYTGTPHEVGLPASAQAAERAPDPKMILRSAIEKVAGRKRSARIEPIFTSIAQRQDLRILRGSESFLSFEDRLRRGLKYLRCLS